MNFLVSIFVKVAKNLVAALVTEKMLIWSLEKMASKTDNMIDDHAVGIIVGGLENDTQKIQDSLDSLVDEVSSTWKNRKK